MKLIKVKNKRIPMCQICKYNKNENFNIKAIHGKSNCQKFLTLFIEAIIHIEDVTATNHYVSKNLVLVDIKQKF